MKPMTRIALAVLAIGIAVPASAQEFPSKPIHLVAPFAPGGAVDIVARTLGRQLGEQLGQPIIVENRPGASGNLAPELVTKAAPDGYTMLIAANGLATNPTLFPNLSFNVQRDLAPVAYIGYSPLLVVTAPSLPAKSLKGRSRSPRPSRASSPTARRATAPPATSPPRC